MTATVATDKCVLCGAEEAADDRLTTTSWTNAAAETSSIADLHTAQNTAAMGARGPAKQSAEITASRWRQSP